SAADAGGRTGDRGSGGGDEDEGLRARDHQSPVAIRGGGRAAAGVFGQGAGAGAGRGWAGGVGRGGEVGSKVALCLSAGMARGRTSLRSRAGPQKIAQSHKKSHS